MSGLNVFIESVRSASALLVSSFDDLVHHVGVPAVERNESVTVVKSGEEVVRVGDTVAVDHLLEVAIDSA